MEACRYVYDPTTEPRDSAKFIVYFDEDEREMQENKAQLVIAHLESLAEEKLKEESAMFFKWLVLHHLSSCNTHYASALLDHFHSKGLLKGKQTIDNPVKQLKHRYLVVFSMGNQVFAKRYNSIRELKCDTGKRPSQIQRCTKDMTCESLTKQLSSAAQ
eukprot:COSAG06_NODE_10845_length_1607_cov_34.109613_3_plen_159_part_00